MVVVVVSFGFAGVLYLLVNEELPDFASVGRRDTLADERLCFGLGRSQQVN